MVLSPATVRFTTSHLPSRFSQRSMSQRIACIRQADEILVLDNGRLAGRGTHDELMNDCALYREIYFSQFPEERSACEKGGERK